MIGSGGSGNGFEVAVGGVDRRRVLRVGYGLTDPHVLCRNAGEISETVDLCLDGAACKSEGLVQRFGHAGGGDAIGNAPPGQRHGKRKAYKQDQRAGPEWAGHGVAQSGTMLAES